ncbi:hypothetical protein DBR45_52490 [Pseudomonas sp. HMWF031]|nr:hypothetical protein DBR45_52490 [Pseudomonas sp. HMWF031]
MGISKAEQDLKRKLTEIAFSLEDICADLGRLASQLSDADADADALALALALALTERIGKLHTDVDRLKVYADKVRAGWILRVKL